MQRTPNGHPNRLLLLALPFGFAAAAFTPVAGCESEVEPFEAQLSEAMEEASADDEHEESGAGGEDHHTHFEAEETEVYLLEEVDPNDVEAITAAAPDYEYMSLNRSQNPKDPGGKYQADSAGPNLADGAKLDEKYFEPSKYMRWIWGGTSMWLIVNDEDDEYMLIDTYVSKATNGAGSAPNYNKPRTLNRIMRLANTMRGLSAKGYDFVGIVGTHFHGDHTMDMGALRKAMNLDEDKRLKDKEWPFEDKSDVKAAGPKVPWTGVPIPGGATTNVPVIADWGTVKKCVPSEGYECSNKYTHYFMFRGLDGVFRNTHTKTSSGAGARFSNEAIVRKRNGKKDYSCGDCTDGSFKLGHFEIQPFLWDHKDLLGSTTDYRTLAYRVWHDEAPGARKVFITTSKADNEHKWTTGPNGITADVEALLSNYDDGHIWTDHLINAWWRGPAIQDFDAAKIVQKYVRFYDRSDPDVEHDEVAFVLANHYDETLCDHEKTCELRADRSYDMWTWFEDVILNTDDPECNQWADVLGDVTGPRCIEHRRLSWRIGHDK